MKLVFSRSQNIGGRLIRWFSRARWNHVMIWDPTTLTMWEAQYGHGVRVVRGWWPSPGMDILSVRVPLTEEEEERMREFLADQVRKRYDWLAILRFVTRRKPDPRDQARRWFCSELAAAAFGTAGRVLQYMPYETITPGMLHASPALAPTPMKAAGEVPA